MTASGHRCGICSAENAPWGYRLPGLLSDLPANRRLYLWACTDHRAQAEARQHRATTISRDDAPATTGQTNLFDL